MKIIKLIEQKYGQIKDFVHETIKPFIDIFQGFNEFCGQFCIQFWEHFQGQFGS